MQAVLGTFENYSSTEGRKLSDLTHAVGSWLTEIFGCAHKEMSRPFSRHGKSYRVCIACGAHRGFDAETWNSRGPYYFEAARPSDLIKADVSTLRCVGRA
jgi:hypothetical protein